MDRKKEEIFRRFDGNLKILTIRAAYAKDEREKEYKDVLQKIEAIKERRHLAQIGEQNQEKQLYSQLLDIVENNFNKGDDFQSIFERIRVLLNDYQVNKKERELSDDGEERE